METASCREKSVEIWADHQTALAGKNFAYLLFTIPYWCGMGVLVDVFYRTQVLIFGEEPTPQVVILKVLCDQLLYSPFVAVLHSLPSTL